MTHRALLILIVLLLLPQGVRGQDNGASAGPEWWFPSKNLFTSPLADPLEPGFRGAAVRSILLKGDVLDAERRLPRIRDLGPDGQDWQGIVSFGESFPVRTLADWGAEPESGPQGLQMGILVGVTARFRLATSRNEYLASDWVVGLPLEGAWGAWESRMLLYHRSAHLGDEIIEEAGVGRVGYGHEGIQWLTSRSLLQREFRVYGGGSHLFRSETSGTLAELGRQQRDHWEVQGGLEWTRHAAGADGTTASAEPASPSMHSILALDVKSAERTQWEPQWSVLAGFTFTARARSGMVALRWIHGPAIHGEFFLRPETAMGLEFRLTP